MRLSARHKTWLTAISLFLVPPVFFWRETLGRQTLGYGDILSQCFPTQLYAYELLRSGAMPLWQPHLYAGMPLFARWQQGLLDPIHLLYLGGVTARALTLDQELSFIIALLATFAFARSLELNRSASIFAAAIYALNSFAVARSIYPGQTRILALIPLVLLCIERLHRQGRWRDAAWGALVVAWQLFAGHPQPFAYAALLAFGYVAFRGFCEGEPGRGDQSARRGRFFRQCAAVYALGIALAAIQILPAWELSRVSVRRQPSFDFFTWQSLHPLSLLNTLFPFFHGQGSGIYHLSYWGSYWTHNEGQFYLGLLALVLTCASVYALWGKRGGQIKFWGTVALLGALCALGKYVWPLAWLLYRVPLLNSFRSPNRHWMEVTLAVALLAGFAIDQLLREEARQLTRVVISMAIGLTLFCAGCATLLLRYSDHAEAAIRALPDLHFLPADFLREARAEFVIPVITAMFLTAALAVFLYTRQRQRWFPLLLASLLGDYYLYATFAPVRSGPRLEESVGRAIPRDLAVRELEQAPFRYHLLLKPDEGEFNPFLFAGHEMTTGYDPLLDERYRAFTNINEAGRSERWQILAATDRTLDLLNVRYLLVPAPLLVPPALAREIVEIGGVPFAVDEASKVELRSGQSTSFSTPAGTADLLALVSTLANAAGIGNDAPVAEITITCISGAQVKLPLRAGHETAEWAYERADVRAIIKHARPTVAESWRGDEAGSFQAHSYLARLPLPEAVAQCAGPRAVKVTVQAPADVTLSLKHLTLQDTATKHLLPAQADFGANLNDTDRWRAVELAQPIPFYQGLQVYENLRVLPRAWLTYRAEVRTEAEQLRLIRGEATDNFGKVFDPTITALVTPETAAKLDAILLASTALNATNNQSSFDQATITSRTANALTISVDAAGPAMMMMSEVAFPGWYAKLDGQATELLRADYLLRGVAVPPGHHSIEVYYRPMSFRLGLLITSLAALGACLLFFFSSKQAKQALP